MVMGKRKEEKASEEAVDGVMLNAVKQDDRPRPFRFGLF
jgi:hypothetical protein